MRVWYLRSTITHNEKSNLFIHISLWLIHSPAIIVTAQTVSFKIAAAQYHSCWLITYINESYAYSFVFYCWLLIFMLDVELHAVCIAGHHLIHEHTHKFITTLNNHNDNMMWPFVCYHLWVLGDAQGCFWFLILLTNEYHDNSSAV